MTYSECLNLNHAVKLAFSCLNASNLNFSKCNVFWVYMAYINAPIWFKDVMMNYLYKEINLLLHALHPPIAGFDYFFEGLTHPRWTQLVGSSVSDAVIEALVLKCCCRSWLHIHRNLLLPCAEYTWVKCALLLTNSLCLSPCLQ